MFKNDSINDLENYININQQRINEYEEKIIQLKNQNTIYQNQIIAKKAQNIIKVITITKDKGWHDTTLYFAVMDVSEDDGNFIQIYTSDRIPWNERHQVSAIIDRYFELYSDIKKIISYGYPISKKIKAKYSSQIYIE